MFVLAVVATVLLLLETLPSAIAGLTRARVGLTRLDQLTRLGLLEGRNLPVATALGGVHLAGCAAVIAGLWVPALGVPAGPRRPGPGAGRLRPVHRAGAGGADHRRAALVRTRRPRAGQAVTGPVGSWPSASRAASASGGGTSCIASTCRRALA
jgi:hypothetical protein